MNSNRLKQSYCKHLVKVGVNPRKAKQAAKALTIEELQMIGEIWADWASVLSQSSVGASLTKAQDRRNWQKHPDEQEVHRSVYCKIKRAIDLLGALLGLLLTAIIFVPLVIATQLDSPGPVFYSQLRCGLRGKPFRIWKFRSMVENAEQEKHLVKNEINGCIFKNKNDPRVTRVGRFLRRTSIDEFPQFWNVLRGEMSLVGTRPPTPDEVEKYKSHHFQRLLVKPGITGEWQVNGRSTVNNFEDVVRMDIDYQNRWSTWYDLKLILRTISVVLIGKGAY